MKKYIKYVFHLVALSLILGCAYANVFVGVAIGVFMLVGLFVNTLGDLARSERETQAARAAHTDTVEYLVRELGGTLVRDALLKRGI